MIYYRNRGMYNKRRSSSTFGRSFIHLASTAALSGGVLARGVASLASAARRRGGAVAVLLLLGLTRHDGGLTLAGALLLAHGGTLLRVGLLLTLLSALLLTLGLTLGGLSNRRLELVVGVT